MAQMLGSIADGMILNEVLVPGSNSAPVDWDPAVAPEATDTRWTLFAIAVESVVRNVTEPIDPTCGGSRTDRGQRTESSRT